YTVEGFMTLLVNGIGVLREDWMIGLDLLIIVCGYVEFVLSRLNVAGDLAARIGLFRVLRMARIMRLMQLLRKSRSLKELQKLVTMMATCLKALTWSFLFCFVIMTVWAMLLVEVVHPLIQQLQDESGVFDDCKQCLHATRSVMDANLLLFKTVIAGDSWGLIAVPVIEAFPATAVIFVGSLLTLVFGVLNLIVAVVVDTFAEVRESDVVNLAEEMGHTIETDKKILQQIFERLDVEKKGELSLDDLMAGARKDPEFQSRLRVMDIDEVDLTLLFEMIDADGSGAIEAQEFVIPFSRWVHESKTAPRFIKYNLMHTMQQQEEMLRLIHSNFALLNTRITELSESLEKCGDQAGPGVMPQMTSPYYLPSNAASSPLLPFLHSRNDVNECQEEVEQPRRSNETRSERPDLAVRPTLEALERSLRQSLNASLEKAEAILREHLVPKEAAGNRCDASNVEIKALEVRTSRGEPRKEWSLAQRLQSV
ncbi:unnamed protein product, partial [Effrenium voratum]